MCEVSNQVSVLEVMRYIILLLLWYLSNITKYAIKTGDITQVTLLTNVTRYLSNVVTVTSLILLLLVTKLQILLVIHCVT